MTAGALVLANETGHRIGAIRKLRWSDVDLKAKRVTWRAEDDKIGMEHSPPLSAKPVKVLEAAWRKRAAIGDGWVLPSPENAKEPASTGGCGR
jgi:integrase